MTTRNILIIGAAALAALAASFRVLSPSEGPSSGRTDAAMPRPDEILPAELDVGEVPANFTLPVQIPVANRNSQAIRLTFKSADCGCLAGREGILLGPGQAGSLKLTYSTGGRIGPVSRSITYTLSGLGQSREVKVGLTATIIDPLIKPPAVHIGTLSPNESKPVTFQVRPSPGWTMMDVRQARGPNEATISKKLAAVDGRVGRLSLEVRTPDFSADDLTWVFELDFRSNDGLMKASSNCVVSGTVRNDVFRQNSLYLGIVKKSEGLTASREFELVDKNFDLGRLRLSPSGDHPSIAFTVGPGGTTGFAQVRVSLPADASEGLLSFFFECAAAGTPEGASIGAVKIPVKLMVLQ